MCSAGGVVGAAASGGSRILRRRAGGMECMIGGGGGGVTVIRNRVSWWSRWCRGPDVGVVEEMCFRYVFLKKLKFAAGSCGGRCAGRFGWSDSRFAMVWDGRWTEV